MAVEDSSSPPRVAPVCGPETVESPLLMEEEAFSWYTPENFYPVEIGQMFKNRYQVLGKLGYGSVSTAWLCRDLMKHEYVTLKIYVNDHRQARNELNVLEHLRALRTKHAGKDFIRQVRDTFEVDGERGPHRCLIHDPLSLTLSDVRKLCDGRLPADMLKPIVKYILLALDFLHTEAKVVHTDVQEGNVMMTSADDSIWRTFVEEEWAEPSARKKDGNRVIYASRAPDVPDEPGHPVLCDFGDAKFGDMPFVGEVMPDLYRAPEIILGIPWDEKIDIWSLGLMVWDLFEGKHLFNERLPSRDASSPAHLARMITLLGPPSVDLISRGKVSREFFDDNGTFRFMTLVNVSSLEDEEENLQGREKELFLEFLRKMLRWAPEDRKTAKELIEDEWLDI